MSYFSDSEINEAKKRVREMQNKANKFIESEAPPNAANSKRTKNDIPITENGNKKSEDENDDEDSSFFIILALILLLSKEDADQMLILALLYLLL